MIYTVEMVQSAVESASKSARAAGAADERDRICRIVAAHAEMTSSDEAREAIWEAIRQIREEAIA
jgi:hypothetical protein